MDIQSCSVNHVLHYYTTRSAMHVVGIMTGLLCGCGCYIVWLYNYVAGRLQNFEKVSRSLVVIQLHVYDEYVTSVKSIVVYIFHQE